MALSAVPIERISGMPSGFDSDGPRGLPNRSANGLLEDGTKTSKDGAFDCIGGVGGPTLNGSKSATTEAVGFGGIRK